MLFLSVSCNNKGKNRKKETVDSTTLTNDSLKINAVTLLDSTIILSNFVDSKYHGNISTDSLAKKILYDYANKKGYYNSDNLPDLYSLSDKDRDKLSIAYDTIYFTDLNNNKSPDAVITYWLTAPYESGHCLLPHKAILVDTDNGYKVINEEFVPSNYIIDSIQSKEGRVVLFGYDYECANDKILRRLRLKLK